jgi:lysophospholipase L1-like esterase
MVFSSLFSRLWNDSHSSQNVDGHSAGTRQQKHRCNFDQLEERTVLSTLMIATMGDSMTAPYSGYRASAGDRSWIQLLQMQDGSQIQIFNAAGPGATSIGVMNGQAARVAGWVQSQGVGYVMLEIGGNDVVHDLPQILLGDSSVLNTTVANIENALTQVASVGNVHEVVGLLPDVSLSPTVQARLGYNPVFLAEIHSAVVAANQKLEAWALSHDVAVIDLNAIYAATGHPFNMYGYQITHDFFSPDGFHPGNVEQAMIANSVLTAFGRFGANISGLRLTDQFIAQVSGNTGNGIQAQAQGQGATYYNVNPFVIGPAGAASTLAPASAGGISQTSSQSWYLGGPGGSTQQLPSGSSWYLGGPHKVSSLSPSSTLLPDALGSLDFLLAV